MWVCLIVLQEKYRVFKERLKGMKEVLGDTTSGDHPPVVEVRFYCYHFVEYLSKICEWESTYMCMIIVLKFCILKQDMQVRIYVYVYKMLC